MKQTFIDGNLSWAIHKVNYDNKKRDYIIVIFKGDCKVAYLQYFELTASFALVCNEELALLPATVEFILPILKLSLHDFRKMRRSFAKFAKNNRFKRRIERLKCQDGLLQ